MIGKRMQPKRPRVNGASDRGGSDFSSPRHIFANSFPWNRSAGYPLTNSLIFLIKIYMIEKLPFFFHLFQFYNANFNNESYIFHTYRFNNLCVAIILKYLIILFLLRLHIVSAIKFVIEWMQHLDLELDKFFC